MPTLFELCGLPFSGKSTLARALAARLRIPCVELDAVNTERGQGLNGAPLTPEEWTATYDEVYRRIASHLRPRRSVIFDAVNFTRPQRDEVRMLAEGCGASVCLIYLAVPSERAIARWQRNRLTGERHDVPDDNFVLVLDHFELPADDEDALVYDGSQPPDDWLAAHFLI
jgi:predicted kinase